MKDFIYYKDGGDWFYSKYFEKLGERYWTFKIALNLFLQRRGNRIVETGCIRMSDDWGAGNSTYILADFCKQYNKKFISVDNNKFNISTAKNILGSLKNQVTFVESDSVEFLKNYSDKIDLLYLDSLDYDESNPSPSQQHALNELKAAWDKLGANSVILLDDNKFEKGGKTKLAKEFLLEHGAELIIDDKQSLWSLR